MQHTAGGHNDEKDILPFSNRLYSCDFAAADHALRLVRLYHKPDAERIILWICAEKPIFLLFSLQIRLFPSCLLKYVIKIGESALFPIAKKEKGQGR